MASTPLDEILSAIRVRVEQRNGAAQTRAQAIKHAADAYVAAVEKESLSELAGKVDVGIATAGGPSARDAAAALRAAVAEIPELRMSSQRVAPSPVIDAPRGNARAPGKQSWSDELATRSAELEARSFHPGAAPLPRVKNRAAKIIVVGGLPKGEKLARVEESVGPGVEWIGADKAGKNAIRSLEGRILDGRVAGVVLLDGFIGHSQSEPIVRAARQTGTPLAYADKGGLGAIGKALTELEAELGRRRNSGS